jgi:hypothetical protein
MQQTESRDGAQTYCDQDRRCRKQKEAVGEHEIKSKQPCQNERGKDHEALE